MVQLGNGLHIGAWSALSLFVAWKFPMLGRIVPDPSARADLRLTSGSRDAPDGRPVASASSSSSQRIGAAVRMLQRLNSAESDPPSESGNTCNTVPNSMASGVLSGLLSLKRRRTGS